MEDKIVVCSTTLTAGFLERCLHIHVTEREKWCVCLPQLTESIWRRPGSGWPVEPVWVMDDNNYVEHPLAWRMLGWVEGKGAGVAWGGRVMFMWYNNSEACLFIPGTQSTPSPTTITTLLSSVSDTLLPTKGGVVALEPAPRLSTIHSDNASDLQTPGKHRGLTWEVEMSSWPRCLW